MRNLKKILAMVLALVMSLSLMATAGAADFKDQADISEKYQTAVEVLRNLEVFNGYAEDNTFRPENSITREEVAAIIYRIATGDVKGASAGIYADYNIFKDVTPDRWSAGYINFCANAEYIKGHGNGNFDPKGNVTGYEALAMILRAIGYTANGGFSGPEWHLQTGRVAEARGITKNVQMGTLGEPASRQTVAELLFQSILVNMVNYDQRTGYYELEQSLGYKVFQLEELEGVVVANEFANLNTDQVLAEGKTQIQVADETSPRTLNISSDLTDIGESRYVYTQNTSKVLTMGDTGKNTVKENDGAALQIDTASRFQAAAGMPQASDIEYYVNFDRVGTYTCDQRLEFAVIFATRQAELDFQRYAGVDVAEIAAEDNKDGNPDNNWSVDVFNITTNTSVTDLTGTIGSLNSYNNVTGYTYPIRYNKIIRAGNSISQDDLNVIRGIFGAADNSDNNLNTTDRILGDVFVGTVSTNPTLREEEDLSNKISYNTFFETYINDITYNVNWNIATNGDWVKFIDNDGDGRCDYAFRTDSWLDEAIDTYKSGDETILEFCRFEALAFNDNNNPRVVNNGYKVRYMNDAEIKVGDRVVCALIDNQILVEPANSKSVTVTNYNWHDDQIKTADGETFGQSFIGNATDMQVFLSTMENGVEYVVYFDHFGYVRAYEIPGGTQYALVTEIYGTNSQMGNLIYQNSLTAELKIGNDPAHEYGVANPGSPLVSSVVWTTIGSSVINNVSYNNFLQPAIAHLGVGSTDGFNFGPVVSANSGARAVSFKRTVPATYSFWRNSLQVVKAIDALGTGEEFNYGRYTFDNTTEIANPGMGTSNATVSFTNVAAVNINGENATLNGAAKLRRNQAGQILARPDGDLNRDGIWQTGDLPRYAVDYVQLTTANTTSGQTRYAIDPSYNGWQGNAGNNYVSATRDTQYYIVFNRNVYAFTGYENMPKLTMADNNIHAAYAVAHDTSADNAANPYWVADVIVYEVGSWSNSDVTSVALIYDNPSRNDSQVQQLEVLDSKNDPTMTTIVPNRNVWTWNAEAGRFNNYSGYGFYRLWDGAKQDDGTLAVSNMQLIDGTNSGTDLRWNSNLIYAGVVVNQVELATRGAYLNVDTDGDGNTNVSLLVNDSSSSNVYSVSTITDNIGSRWAYNQAGQLRYNDVRTSEIKAGDRIVWVGNSAINVKGNNNTQASAFVVDLGNDTIAGENANVGLRDVTATFLYNPTTGAGLWRDIMTEQRSSTAAPSSTVEVTVKYTVDPAASVVDKLAFAALNKSDYKINVLKDTAVTYNSTDPIFNIDGWTPSYMSAVDADGNAVGTPGTTSVALIAGDMDSDITITVTYTRIPNSVTVTLASFTAGESVSYNIPTATTISGSFTTNSVIGAGMVWDGDGTLNWTGAANTDYAISATSNATFTLSNTGNAYTLRVENVRGSAAVTITAAPKAATTVTGATDAGVASWVITPATAYAGDTISATPTLNLNYVIDRVYWTDDAGLTKHVMTELPGSGVYVSSDPIGTDPVVIYAETHSTKVTVIMAVDTTSYTGTWSAVGTGAAAPITSAGSLVMDLNGNVTITGSANMWVLATVGTSAATTIQAPNGNGSTAVGCANATGAVTLTIYGTQAAYDTAVAALT